MVILRSSDERIWLDLIFLVTIETIITEFQVGQISYVKRKSLSPVAWGVEPTAGSRSLPGTVRTDRGSSLATSPRRSVNKTLSGVVADNPASLDHSSVLTTSPSRVDLRQYC